MEEKQQQQQQKNGRDKQQDRANQPEKLEMDAWKMENGLRIAWKMENDVSSSPYFYMLDNGGRLLPVAKVVSNPTMPWPPTEKPLSAFFQTWRQPLLPQPVFPPPEAALVVVLGGPHSTAANNQKGESPNLSTVRFKGKPGLPFQGRMSSSDRQFGHPIDAQAGNHLTHGVGITGNHQVYAPLSFTNPCSFGTLNRGICGIQTTLDFAHPNDQ